MREIKTIQYSENSPITDENLLANFKMLDPVRLSRNLTYLYGKKTRRYPLIGMTEGNKAVKGYASIALNDTQYVWDVMGRMKLTSPVVQVLTGGTRIGENHQPFDIIMGDDWFIHMYSAFTPDGKHQVRIQTPPQMIGPNRYKYTFVLQGGDPNEYITADNFTDGKYWVMGAPTVAASESNGNYFHSMAPGKWTNQFGFHRYSLIISGNVANKAIQYEFDATDSNGNPTKVNGFLPLQMKEFEDTRRALNEYDLWMSEYNRDDKGIIHLKDPETGKPIPRGAGVKQQVKAVGNYDTFGTLSLKKIDNTVTSVLDTRDDDTPTEIILYTGKGGAKEFHRVMENEGKNKGYIDAMGQNIIKEGADGYMTYGNYFNQYKTITGHIITVKIVDMFDNGPLAEAQKKNGMIVDGYPLESYNMVFLDHSMSDNGERNIQLVHEKGREYMVGVYAGMTNLPGVWGLATGILKSDRKDIATYETMDSQGVCIRNATTSFWLERSL